MNNILQQLNTEQRNLNTTNIDCLSVKDIVTIINKEDHLVAPAIKKIIPDITSAVEIITRQLKNGGRLIYIGAGTSGRLGVLDASECPPTYGTPNELIQAFIAGGPPAMYKAQEGAEDSEEFAIKDLSSISFNKKDVLVGIAASGRTPYVLGGLKYASSLNAPSIALVNVSHSAASQVANITLAPITGPEVITGSTRMKAGSAQKMVLNILTTTSMIMLGKVYSNYMVDLQATNHKLQIRSLNIIRECTGCNETECLNALQSAKGNVKKAIYILLTNASETEAQLQIDKFDGNLRNALKAAMANKE